MQKLYRKVIFLLCIFFVLFTTVVFSALSTSLAITTDVVIRPISDIRVDSVVLSGSTVDGATLQYESEFNMDKITNGFILPNTNSSITYKVTISNNGDYDQTIYNITTNSNINCNYVIKYSNGNTFNYKDIIEKKTSVDLYITYTPTTPSNSVINITHNFDFRKVYKIVYQEQGGTSVTDQYKYEKEDLILNSINNVIEKPTKTNYNFLGWTDIENGSVVKFHAGDTLTIDLDENPIYTLYAIYELSNYIITFNPDNGENNIVRTISAGNPVGTLPDVSKTGYTLDGWYNTSDNQITSSTIPTKDETYKAKWIANTYTITLDKNGSTNNPTSSITATYDSSDLEPARIILPEKQYTISNFGLSSSRKSDNATVSSTNNLTTSYSFNGWYTQSTNGIQLMDNQETPTLIPSINDYTDEESKWIHDEDITLFARFSGSGSITLPTIEKTGYTCGWTANESGTIIQLQSGETITPILSTALYGVCVPNTYTVTADSNGGSIPSTNGWTGTGNTSTKTVTYDSEYETLPTPTRTGYTFNGWYNSNDKEVISSTTVTQSKNHTLTAKWTANTYAVILDSGSSTTSGTTGIYEKYDTGYYLDITQNKKMTTSSNEITVPTRKGYVFGGYYTETNGGGVQYIDSNGKLTSNASTTNFTNNSGKLYAKWTYANNDPETVIKSLNTEGVSIATTDHENELRFIGSNPNNYVKFNNQTWRIIGIFDGKLKLIQNPIGNYSYDTSKETVNRGFGVNAWEEADLMKLLNPGYDDNSDLKCNTNTSYVSNNGDGYAIVNCGDNSASNYTTEEVNNSLYWNAGSGKCYTYGNYQASNCDFTNTGLSDTASKNMIDNAEWYLGSLDSPSANIWDGRVTASLLYDWERSNNSGKQCTQNNYYCSDTVNRATRWTGKVGLLYPSDYAYATSGGNTHDRDACLSYTVGYVSSSSIPNWENTYTDCKNNDWLLNTSMWTWTLSTRADSSFSTRVFRVRSAGYVDDASAFGAGSVRPVVYLKSSIEFTGGDGSSTNPFILNDTTPDTYSVILDSGNAKTLGTQVIYEKYNKGYYLDSKTTTSMNSNSIILPTRTGYVFKGYYTGKNGTGTKIIDSSGKLTSGASTTNFSDNTGVLYAKWTKVMAENIEYNNGDCTDVQCMIDEIYNALK